MSLCRRNQATDTSGLVPSRWGAAGSREQAGISGERVPLSARSPSSQKAREGRAGTKGTLAEEGTPPSSQAAPEAAWPKGLLPFSTAPTHPALIQEPQLPRQPRGHHPEPGGDVAVHTARKRPPLHQEKTGGCSIPGAWDVQKSSGRCRAWLRQGHRLGATAPCTQARLVSDAHAHQKAPLNQSGDRERGGKQPQGLGAHCRDRHGDRVGGSSHI